MKKSFIISVKKKWKEYCDNRMAKHYLYEVQKNYANLPQKTSLTKEQKEEISEYWKRLTGRDLPLDWHQYFYARTGRYSKEYVPTGFYNTVLVRRANSIACREAYVDKNMLDIVLPNTKHPKVLLSNVSGYFYWEGEPVSREQAIQKCQNLDKCLIKPTLESHGDGVRVLKIENGLTNIDGLSVDELFKRYRKNYCIQEFVQQHDRMKALNPTSVNTIRILTFRSGMEVLILYTAIRIGRMGSEIDNESAGGMSAGVNKDGTLSKYAYGRAAEGAIEKTDTGIVLDGYQLPSFDKAIAEVKKCHMKLPRFDLIGWDVAIDPEGDPVIIEFNVRSELSQSAAGPAFGEYTERVVTELMKRKNRR